MKTMTFKSMMIIGMMTMFTANGFAKTHDEPRHHEQPRHEVVVDNRHYDKHHHAVCRMNHRHGRDCRVVEVVRHNPAPRPVPPPPARPVVVHKTNASVATGIVVGAVVGGIISALAHSIANI